MNKKQNVQDSSREDGLPAVIVAAARARFRRFGYAKTSMSELAEDCNMSAANLYRYYASKLEIGAAVAAAEQADLFADCDRAVGQAPADATSRLIALFYATINGARRQMHAAPLLFELRLSVTREKPALRESFLNEVERRIVAIVAEAGWGDAASVARLIQLATAPFVLPWMLQNTPFGDPRPRVAPLVHALVAGMASGVPALAEVAAAAPAPVRPRPRGADAGI